MEEGQDVGESNINTCESKY